MSDPYQFSPFVTAILVVALCVGAPVLAYFLSAPIEKVIRFFIWLWPKRGERLFGGPMDALVVHAVGALLDDLFDAPVYEPTPKFLRAEDSPEAVAAMTPKKKKNGVVAATATRLPKTPVKGSKQSAPRAGTQKNGPKSKSKRGKRSK